MRQTANSIVIQEKDSFMNIRKLAALISLVMLASITGCDRSTDPKQTGDVTTPSPTVSDPGRVPPAPDNTARNKLDGADAKTPMDQSQSSPDIKITADIRRAIMEDKGMSMNAQNCKIITDKSGAVTLRGVVNSQVEKDSIEAKANAVAGTT